MMQDSAILQGVVTSITFHNEDNGFTVMELEAGEEYHTVVGEIIQITEGEEIKCTGRFMSHHTYGQQFKATLIERILPSTTVSIMRYLSGGAVKGIGPRFAKRIVDMFGDKTLDIIENSPNELAKIKGISKSKAQEIAIEYKKIYGLRTTMMFLTKYGIATSTSIAIWKRWGASTQDTISNDPYSLCDNSIGVKFELADNMATQMGFSHDDICRIRSGILFILSHNLNNGHSCLPYSKLSKTAADFLEIEHDLIEVTIDNMCEQQLLMIDKHEKQEYAYLPEQYKAETFCAQRISNMLKLSYGERAVNDKEIEALEKELKIKYASLQRRALKEVADHSVMILTGGPGTGKTTTLNGIIKLFERRAMKVGLVAPTGRAAKRLSELTSREAKTIHRMLEVDFSKDMGYPKFKRHEKNTLPYDVIIVDEMSMVDICLFESLLRAIRIGGKVIMVGDPNQLPSVGAGNVLKDLINSDMVPTINLVHIFRQAAESLIIVNAHNIVSGKMPDLDIKSSDFFFMPRQNNAETVQAISELCASRLPKAYGYSPTKDIQVLSPSRIGGVGTVELNKSLQSALNPPDKKKTEITRFGQIYREGDKVMQMRNNYDMIWTNDNGEDGLGIFNGDIGIIDMIDKPSSTVFIKFDDKIALYSMDMLSEIDLAYAITVHKSQGNEFDAVIIPVLGTHKKLHYRNLLYTGVTRAKKTLILIGHKETIEAMVSTNSRTLRYTNLKCLICENIEGQ